MHKEPKDEVVVVNVWGAKFDFNIVDGWVKESSLVQSEVGLEVNIKIFEV